MAGVAGAMAVLPGAAVWPATLTAGTPLAGPPAGTPWAGTTAGTALAGTTAGTPLAGSMTGTPAAGTPAAFTRVAGTGLPVPVDPTRAGSAILTQTRWTREARWACRKS
jgi:hypothetical protein